MLLPEIIRDYIADKTGLKVKNPEPVQGGSINRSVRLETNQEDLFLKWNSSAPSDMFEKEMSGLELLRKADTDIIVPEIVMWNRGDNTVPGFLLMHYIQPGQGQEKASVNFGRQLARMHRQTSAHFGLGHDNYIGRLPQSNHLHSEWVDFFVLERIEPQLKLAVESGVLDHSILKHWQNLAKRLNGYFPDTDPCLLHGDLWSGNYFFNKKNQPVLIDPAVYYGHPEIELSFTRMFGGFSPSFYQAYREENPLEPGFDDRVPVYNLYPLLVHANMFGGHYASGVRSFLQQY